MNKNIPHKGMTQAELKKLLKQSKNATSFAGPQYVAMHKSVIQEIQAQKDRNAKAAQKSLYMAINSGYEDSLRLQTEVQDLADKLAMVAKESNFISSSSQAHDCSHVDRQIENLHELAIPNIIIETQAEPRAENILVRGEKAQSRKLYNIRFNLKGLMSLLSDWILLGEINPEDGLVLLVMLIRSLSKLYDLSLIEFDYIHSIILREWYLSPKENGAVNEDKLINVILKKYKEKIPNLNKVKIIEAVNQLEHFHCAEVVDGKIIVTESLVIE